MHRDTLAAGAPQWRGQPDRLEVHYVTATDESTGTGLWVHHEVVAPTDGDPYAHGWAAVFPPDARPTYERFGPTPSAPHTDDDWFCSSDATMTSTAARGVAGEHAWDLTWTADAAPLWTFPRWVWQHHVLPAAQVVPTPTTRVTGILAGRAFDGPGGVAHIYGHGNAERWVWLHADLGGGDVLEIVAATARRPGLRALPPLPLVQLRHRGRDWPRDPLAAALLFRARIDADGFRISGTVGRRRLRVEATLPPDRCVVVGYTDPDGETATCTNTERADVRVRLGRLTPGGWRREQAWSLDGTGHAEIGRRP